MNRDEDASGVVPGVCVTLADPSWVSDLNRVGLVLARYLKRDVSGDGVHDCALVLLGHQTYDLIPSGLAIVVQDPLPST